MWLYDIHHGLLWEQHSGSAAEYKKGCEAPTWSWASTCHHITWAKRCAESEEACLVTEIISSNGVRRKMGEIRQPINTIPAVVESNDLTEMFHCLAIRGRLQRVLVRGLFKDDDRETAADLSDHDSDLGRESWRICGMIQSG